MIGFVLGIIFILASSWIIYFKLANGSVSDEKLGYYLSFSALFMVAGLLLVFSSISVHRLLIKVVGLIVFMSGYFLSFGFPDMKDYHPKDFDYLPFILGFIIMSIGAYLLLFY